VDDQISIIGAQLTMLQADAKKVERGACGPASWRIFGPGRGKGRRLPGARLPTPSSGLANQGSGTLIFFHAKEGQGVPGANTGEP
jgi:hypothetical protein